MHKIIFFPERKNNLKICMPNLPKISDPLPETHLFFYLALVFLTYILVRKPTIAISCKKPTQSFNKGFPSKLSLRVSLTLEVLPGVWGNSGTNRDNFGREQGNKGDIG